MEFDSNRLSMIKAVIFDMDGVVVESTGQDFSAWKKTFKEQGRRLTYDQYLSFLGKKGEEIVQQNINPRITKDEAAKIVKRKEQILLEDIRKNGIKPIKGAKQTIQFLRQNNFKIGLGTSAPIAKADVILESLGIKNLFDTYVVAEEVKRGKPHPEIYLKVAKKLNLNSKECLVIEDAPAGIAAAKNAGMKCIAITTTHKREDLLKADKIISLFKELTLWTIRGL